MRTERTSAPVTLCRNMVQCALYSSTVSCCTTSNDGWFTAADAAVALERRCPLIACSLRQAPLLCWESISTDDWSVLCVCVCVQRPPV